MWQRKCLDRRSARSVGQPQQSSGIGTPSAIYIGSCARTHLFVSSSPSLCVVAFRPPWGLVLVLVPLFLETYSAPFLSGPTSTSLQRTCYTQHHKPVTASRSRIYVYLKAPGTLLSLCSPRFVLRTSKHFSVVIFSTCRHKLGSAPRVNGSMSTSRPPTHSYLVAVGPRFSFPSS